MPKNIIFCADGTWNGPGVNMDEDMEHYDNSPTNIWKLFDNLQGSDSSESKRLQDEQERYLYNGNSIDQAAKYIHGVGDSRNPIIKLLGGGMGAGIIKRIVRGYTFISRHYEVDDRIYIIGFSRGAYTARALAGFILSQGLLKQAATKGNKEIAYMKGAAAWHAYRSKGAHRTGFLDQLKKALLYLPGLVADAINSGDYIPVNTIQVVGVFDTVGALGIPFYSPEDKQRYDAFQFADLDLSSNVVRGIHAVSIDERRADFTPTLWNPGSNLIQALFPGGHSDVGGGYPDVSPQSDLSDVALAWMQTELTQQGVLFNKAAVPYNQPDPRSQGTAHDECSNGVWLPVAPPGRLFEDQRHNPRTDLAVHRVVLNRWGNTVQCDPNGSSVYNPQNLNGFIDSNGKPRPGINIVQ